MVSPHATRRKTATLDEESQAMLFDGLNLSQLGIAFRMDHRILVEKLHRVPATGLRNGTETWRIDVAAPHLVKPTQDIETYLKNMNHADLPKQLSKEFWAGQKTRQEVLRNSGDLWPTERVVGVIGSLMKLTKMSVRLMADSVDNEFELNDKQRRKVRQLCDSLLEQLYEDVRESFKPKKDREGKELPVGEAALNMSERLVEVLKLDADKFDRLMQLAQEDADEL